MPKATFDKTAERIVRELLARGGNTPQLTDGLNLMSAGLCSEDGVELACDLEARLGIDVPHDCNPLVHENKKRMRTVGELKAWVRSKGHAPAEKAK